MFLWQAMIQFRMRLVCVVTENKIVVKFHGKCVGIVRDIDHYITEDGWLEMCGNKEMRAYKLVWTITENLTENREEEGKRTGEKVNVFVRENL